MMRKVRVLLSVVLGILAVVFVYYRFKPKPLSVPLTSSSISVYTYKIIKTYPHDPDAFTQGLVFEDGILYEGTGREKQSTLRKVDLETGRVLNIRRLPDDVFGEGITIYGDNIIQLTYTSRIGFVYDKTSLELVRKFSYPTQGWGITHDGNNLIMSDGTSKLHFLDPESLEDIGTIEVNAAGVPVEGLNELEFVKGQIFANVRPTKRIARISPATGQVTGWIDLTWLQASQDPHEAWGILNGIAYDSQADRLFVTGKLWPKIFEIQLIPL